MATKNYQYRAQLIIQSGGYPGETTGVIPADDSWHTTTAESGSATFTYYYNDSTCASNSNSSRVEVNITDTWTASVDEHNKLYINVHSVINSIVRSAYQGDPNACANNILVDIIISRIQGGATIARFNNLNLASYGTIASNIDCGSYTMAIDPGQSATRTPLLYKNDAHYAGGSQEGLYDDIMRMGLTFKNILPADYRPGKVWNGSTWLSHDRTGGAANVRNTSSFVEMRTVDGPTGTGNPPLIRDASTYHNMRLIGQNS